MYQVYNGHFDGLSTLERTGETSLELTPFQETKAKLTANIGIKHAKAGYEARYNINILELAIVT